MRTKKEKIMSFFIEHADTLVILGGVFASMCWIDAKFDHVNNRFEHMNEKISQIEKEVLIIKKIMPQDVAITGIDIEQIELRQSII